MGSNVASDIQGWLFALLVYPGLLFGMVVALGVEWLVAAVRPRLSPPTFRIPPRPAHLLQPIFSFFRLAGRRGPAGLIPHAEQTGRPTFEALNYVTLAGAIAPVLVLALLPLGGNPAAGNSASNVDVLVVLMLLVVQPLSRGLARLLGGPSSLEGARPLGRLIVGIVPAIVVVAALVEVTGLDTLGLVPLGAAPETGWQFLVRLLAGVALLAALPWWLDLSTGGESAGSLAGRHLQMVALGAFWTALILPRPGDLTWAVVLAVVGTLVASLAIRLVPFLWTPLRTEREQARLVWSSALPLAALALLISVWTTA